jgi:tetratricopeptide (TPR) repeat protein
VERAPGRYSCHDLLRAYAAELVRAHDTDADRSAATHRMLDHYLHTAHAATDLLDPHRDPVPPDAPRPGVTPDEVGGYDAAMAWFAVEHRVLLAVIDQAATAGFDTHAWRLAWYAVTYLDLGGHWEDILTTQRAAEAAARRAGEPAGQARAHRALARAYTRYDRLEDAHTHLRQSIHLYGVAGDQNGQGNAHRNMSLVLDRLGRHDEALVHAELGLDLHRAAGHRQGQAHALNSIGYSYSLMGEHAQAIAYCEQALALFEEVGDRHGLADTWDSLGRAHHHLGHHREAVDCYRHAVDLWRELSDRYNEAFALTRLGQAHHEAGDADPAREARRLALDILDDLGHPDADQVRAVLTNPAAVISPILDV